MSLVRVVIAGGGTGGHLFPGIAVAREILRRRPDTRRDVCGHGARDRVAGGAARGISARSAAQRGLKGMSPAALARGLSLLPLSGVDAWRIISRRRPSVVIGVGGYSSGPVVLAAALRGIPTLLLEQNAVPGLTNRLLARFVSAAAVTFESTIGYFGRRGFVTGNPVRSEFFEPAPAAPAIGPPRILIFGGSQGAHAINMAMVEAAPRLAAHPGGMAITHQTGERDLELVRDGYRRAGLEARVEPFLFAMDREMKNADLVVCRAGATTIAELTAAGVPAVLVPLPTAADDHQRKNAEVLVAGGRGGDDRAEGSDRRVACRAGRTPGRGPRPPAGDVGGGAAVRAARRRAGDRRSGVRARGSGLMLGRTRRIHFVGIGGIGMSGIAELLANLGYEVSGSDAKRSDVTDRLEKLGARVFIGHQADNVGTADVVVVSSAIRRDNPEVAEAMRRRIPVIPRAEMLAELMRLRYGIAVAGAHGKTTTTSMIALVLERAGLDPTAVIGGRLSAFGSNARLGRGEFMVVEADESDRSFLKLSPAIAVITNLDREHMESYGTWENLQQAFVDFANKVPFYGAVVACVDDEPVRTIVPRITRRVIGYGFEQQDGISGARITGSGLVLEAFASRATVTLRGVGGDEERLGELRLNVPGRHNMLNALAAVAVAHELGVPFARIASALGEFRGAERRFQLRGEERGVMVVDDYGHHPTEIAAVIAAARAGIDRRVIVVFQPHRYTRTEQLMPEFANALRAADRIVLTDIYPAGEPPIAGVTIEALADAVRAVAPDRVAVVKGIDELPERVASMVRSGDLVITLGAGSITTVADRILAALRSGQPAPPEGRQTWA